MPNDKRGGSTYYFRESPWLKFNKVINEIYQPCSIEVVRYDDLPKFLKDNDD